MPKSTELGTTRSPTSEWRNKTNTRSRSRNMKKNSKSATETKWKNSDSARLKSFNESPTK